MTCLRGGLSVDSQMQILNDCIAHDLKLADMLQNKGLTYDHLRYNEYVNLPVRETHYEFFDNIGPARDGIPAISFFSGAGGLDLGFEYAGFNNIASIENNGVSCDTLSKNRPKKTVIGPPDFTGDISQREELRDLLANYIGINSEFEGVFHGGPPCQPFSVAANQRFCKQDDNFKRKGFNDPKKGNLLFDYLWFIQELRPIAFMIENVAGIMDCDDGNIISDALNGLASIGYTITSRIVNAAHYGVPQNRLRWIVLGIRGNKAIDFPAENRFATPCMGVFDREIGRSENHVTRKHYATSILRYMQLPYGGRDRLGRVDRLNPYLPSKTVIAGGTKGGGRSHLHPYIPRTLSVRECARLQTFPDDYIFTGSTARQFTQVGNAVPPLLAYKIANAMKSGLTREKLRCKRFGMSCS